MKKQTFYSDVEYRVVKKDDKATTITGYAAKFNRKSQDLGGFREVIAPGAFRKAIESSDVRALFNHDSNFVLGRKTAGTLRLKEDEVGLYMEIDLPDTQFARDLAVSIERGDISQQSFGFVLAKDGDTWDEEDGETVRTLLEVRELFDVSPVTYPAYLDTDVSVRAFDKYKAQKELASKSKLEAAYTSRKRKVEILKKGAGIK